MPGEANGDRRSLFEGNERLVYYIVDKLFEPATPEVRDEMVQEGRVGLWQACLSYDASRGRFGTYASACIRYRIIGWLRATKSERAMAILAVPLDQPLPGGGTLTLQDIIPSDEDVAANVEDRDLCRVISRYRALRLAVGGLSTKEIGLRLSKSPSEVRKRLQDEYRKLKGERKPRRKERRR